MFFDISKLKKPEYTAAISGFVCGVMVHLFGLVNILHNRDDISVQPRGYGTGVASGRWLLTILGDFLKKQNLDYNLGLVNGLLFIALLGISAGILVSIFKIKSRQIAGLVGLIFVSFPTVCATLLYRYTSHYYGLAVLFSVMAVWVLPKYKLGGLLASACFTAMALGIYQAYLPITASVFVLQLCQQTLAEEHGFRKLFGRGVYACASMVLGLLLYFVCNKAALAFYGVTLNDYQGISDMGKIALSDIPALVLNTYRQCYNLVTDGYCRLVHNDVVKYAYRILYLLNAVLVGVVLVTRRKKASDVVMTLLLCAVLPVALFLIEIMCPDSSIYTLMVYSCVMLLIMPLTLLGLLPKKKLRNCFSKIAAAVLLVIVFGNAYFTNTTYTSLYYVNRQAENYMTSMVAQIRMTDGFDAEKKWAVIGTISDPMLDNAWWKAPIYRSATGVNGLLGSYSWKRWITNYIGYSVTFADDAEVEQIAQTQECINMPCWPAEGSIKVIDDAVVIKFQ